MSFTPIVPTNPNDHSYDGKNFIGYLLDGQYEKCRQLLASDPILIDRMTWDKINCSGSWGLSVWRRVGYLLASGDAPVHYLDTTSFEYQRVVMEIARLCEATDPKCNYHACLISYCLAADQQEKRTCWEEVLKDCITKVPFAEKALYKYSPKTATMKAIWDSWTENIEPEDESSCCICMDAKPDAFFSPCAHNEFCFACSRDLNVCPICRSAGYAKQRQ